MTSEKSSVLAKKIAAARNKASPSSNVEDFAAAVAAAVAKNAAALLEAECAACAAMKGGLLGAALDGAADPGIYYWLTDASSEPALLLAVDPRFANVMTTRLLGGELTSPPAEAAATAVDFEMAASLVDLLTAPLNALLQKPNSAPARLSSTGRRGARTLKEVLRERETLAVCAFDIELAVETAKHPKAISLIFARSFLERAGVFTLAAQPAKAAASGWTPALRRNLLNIEIPLAVILGRLMTSVGDLSRLQVGQVIDLNPNALASLEISAATSAGPAYVARGRLGSWQARKAVKLTTDVDQDFVRGL